MFWLGSLQVFWFLLTAQRHGDFKLPLEQGISVYPASRHASRWDWLQHPSDLEQGLSVVIRRWMDDFLFVTDLINRHQQISFSLQFRVSFPSVSLRVLHDRLRSLKSQEPSLPPPDGLQVLITPKTTWWLFTFPPAWWTSVLYFQGRNTFILKCNFRSCSATIAVIGFTSFYRSNLSIKVWLILMDQIRCHHLLVPSAIRFKHPCDHTGGHFPQDPYQNPCDRFCFFSVPEERHFRGWTGTEFCGGTSLDED